MYIPIITHDLLLVVLEIYFINRQHKNKFSSIKYGLYENSVPNDML